MPYLGLFGFFEEFIAMTSIFRGRWRSIRLTGLLFALLLGLFTSSGGSFRAAIQRTARLGTG